MLIPLALQTALTFILFQTAVDTSDCPVLWLNETEFDTIASVELAEVGDPSSSHPVTVHVVCRDAQATVVVASLLFPNRIPSVSRIVTLSDTPEFTRTRTLALAVSDAVKDYVDGLSPEPPIKKESSPSSQTIQPAAPAQNLIHTKPDSQPSDTPLAHSEQLPPGTRRTLLELAVLSSLRAPHPALALRWTFDISRWRVGLQGAGMRFATSSGKAYTGEAVLLVGCTLHDFTTKKNNMGELNIGLLLGIVHSRGYPRAPNTAERHTRPLTSLEADFTWYFHPRQRSALGLRFFGGWTLGLSLQANNETIGGFNGFFAGLGMVRFIHAR